MSRVPRPGGLRGGAAAGVLTLAFAGWVAAAGPDGPPPLVHPDGPLPGFTGGFGEDDCAACHSAPADESAALVLRGVPPSFEPGETYVLTVRVSRSGMGAAGFQLSARWSEGAHEGAAAGRLAARGAGVAVDRAGDPSVEYARQTLEGSRAEDGGTAEWRIVWTAPDAPLGPVRFHLAANAADGDGTEFGDVVERLDSTSRPQGAGSPPAVRAVEGAARAWSTESAPAPPSISARKPAM